MTLRDLLKLVDASKYVKICDLFDEWNFQRYFIEWHYKELLDREVSNMWAENDCVCFYLKKVEE